MRSTDSYNVTCVFCGKERTIESVSDDGIDYLGHARGSAYSKSFDDGCSCELGKIEHAKANIKKMCLNCKFNIDGCCTNANTIDKISNLFDIGKRVRIKSPSKLCSNWELDTAILEKLVNY